MFNKLKRIFLTNLDFIFITLQSLDLEFLDGLLKQTLVYSNEINITISDLHYLRLYNLYRYSHLDRSNITLNKLIILIWSLYKILNSHNMKLFLRILIKTILGLNNDLEYNIMLENYVRRFKYHCKENISFYLFTKKNYYDDIYLHVLAIRNLYILYCLSHLNSLLKLWNYLKKYFFSK
uniref:hypothetical protein n=1 Tax=Pulvinaster venetus TaxID=427767 RepID=UPI001FCD0E53|nr:hypothetical protein MW436_pgp166 [Pulvinaster venetus]UNJ16893.1 hypothetical protein [Pulvinaster venetus]